MVHSAYRRTDIEHEYDIREAPSKSREDGKMWKAQENTRALYTVITRPYNDPEYLKWVISQAFASTTDLMTWLKKIDQYTAGQVPIRGEPGRFYTDPYEDPEFIRNLRNMLLKEWAELSKDFDATSRVAMRDYMVGGWKFPYDMINPSFFLSWAGEGKLLILTGEKDSGKTDWSCEMARIAIEQDSFRVLSNVELTEDYKNYTYCKLFSDMVKHICESKLHGRKTIIIIDEAGLDFPSYEAPTRESKEFDKFTKLTRKFATNQVFIIQYEHQVPWTLRKHYAAWMHKFDTKYEMRYEIKVGKYKGFDQIITGIPRTKMPFRTEHISGMTMDLEVRDMLDFLDTLPPKVNQFHYLVGFVERFKKKPSERQLSTAEKKYLATRVAQLAKENPKAVKVTPQGLAQILQVSTKTIERWRKGMEPEEEVPFLLDLDDRGEREET